MKQKKWILVIDRDEKWLETLRAERLDGDVGLVIASTLRTAQRDLTKKETAYAAVFINPMVGSAWVSLVRLALVHKATTPVWLLLDSRNDFLYDDYIAELGLAGKACKPLSAKELVQQAALAAPKADTPPETKPERYSAVRIAEIAWDTPLSFDVFIKLSESHFVRIGKAGEALDRLAIETYAAKGIKDFHIREGDREKYLEFCDRLIVTLFDTDCPALQKTQQALSHGAEVLSFLALNGFRKEEVQAARSFVSNTRQLIDQISSSSEPIHRLLSDLRAAEHATATTLVGGLVLKHLGASPELHDQIGLACFIHDIALVGKSEALMSEDEARMTPAEKEAYARHPEESARIAQEAFGLKPALVEAIAQHHQRRDGKGFPKRNGVGRLNRIAELIGLSEEVVRLIERANRERELDVLRLANNEVMSQFSEPIQRAFGYLILSSDSS